GLSVAADSCLSVASDDDFTADYGKTVVMKLQVLKTDLHLTNLRLRIPFRFGIVTMTECPHLFIRALLEIDGKQVWGIAADSLPNKWFTKNPTATYEA